MKTIVNKVSDTNVILTITLDANELESAQQVAASKLAKEIKVAGFRKGKAPVSVALKHIDPNSLNEQTIDNALSRAVAEAFITEKLQALSRPSVEVTKFVPSQILEFTAQTDILPIIKLGNYKKLKTPKPELKVTSIEVDEVLERMRSSYSDKKSVDRAVKKGDTVLIDFIGKKDGVAFDGGTGTDYELLIGSNSFIAGFEEGIIGKKPSQEFDLDLKFPDNYHVKDLKSAKVIFTVTIKKIFVTKQTKLDDAFALKASDNKIATIKDLKDDIKRELKTRKEQQAINNTKDSLVAQLIEISKVPVPDVLLKDQEQAIERDMIQNLTYQNITLDMYLDSKSLSKEKWLETEVRDAANGRVKAGLALAELRDQESITVSDEEVEEYIDNYKKQYANNAEVLKQLEQAEVRRDITNRILTEKTIERLVDLNNRKVTS